MPRDGFAIASKLTTARYYHTATLLPDGRVLAVGGINKDKTALATAEIYDPVANSWSATDTLYMPRYHHTAT